MKTVKQSTKSLHADSNRMQGSMLPYCTLWFSNRNEQAGGRK